MRSILALILSAFALVAPLAQEDAGRPAWQDSVSAQIEALRADDGEAALAMAGAAFRASYTDPERFIADIKGAGYAPIAASRSHSFGSSRTLVTGMVVQEVEFIGVDGKVWEAIYQMAEEPNEGWRVQGVILRGTAGIGI
ncbi:protein of unknown function [Devosia lucknowensis]|uniref:DUF4864 domain-containing protein n=1 Tax=Devosia lucknowensis TaxID=1096929 RepID=A0A1Y6FAK0_9HYPH|nr:DUF4864 domain-containing protein [Devosia lucknowensis]SMQ70350.1 protein of unknown function [Devosia lucknowensis]